ncbi:hypothetical protein [Novosphingobium sp.]|uniref:hypothetical protein n=1 Tax=Novosphingobium sp. TaxID=1874826 RepID=UPI0035B022DC
MRRFLLVLAALAATGCVSKLAYGQVKSALVDAGLSDDNAACMATRMTDRLNIIQLNKLKKLKGANRSLGQFLDAVRKIDDPEAIEVTLSAAALCTTGLAPEKR